MGNPFKRAIHHQIPQGLLRFPCLIHVVHAFQKRIYHRNQIIAKEIKSANLLGKAVWDAGCGDGHFALLSIKERASKVWATDTAKSWVEFLNSLEIPQLTASIDNLNRYHQKGPFDVILCLSVLHYIPNKKEAIETLANSLDINGQLLLYIPVNQQQEFRLYRWMFKTFNNYENLQSHRSIISKTEWEILFSKANLVVKKSINTYGKPARLGHEIWSIALMWLSSKRIFWILLGVISLIPAILVSQFLYLFENPRKNRHGNGAFWVLERS